MVCESVCVIYIERGKEKERESGREMMSGEREIGREMTSGENERKWKRNDKWRKRERKRDR